MDRENGKHPAGGTPKKSRPKKPKKPSRLTRQQKLLIAVAVVLAIVLIAVVACQSLFVRPDLPDKNADADSGNPGRGDRLGRRDPAPAATGNGRVRTITRS